MNHFVSEIAEILFLSLRVSTLAVGLSTVIGIPLGAGIGLWKSRWRNLARMLVHTGMALPPVLVGLLLYLLLSRSGPLGFLDGLFTPRAMVLAQVLLAVPFVTGIVMNSVSAVPDDLGPQLRGLGASKRQLRWAILREARPGILLAVAAAFGRSISEVGAVLMIGGNIKHHTRVLTTAIVLETSKGQLAFALALGAVLLALALLVNILILRMPGANATP